MGADQTPITSIGTGGNNHPRRLAFPSLQKDTFHSVHYDEE